MPTIIEAQSNPFFDDKFVLHINQQNKVLKTEKVLLITAKNDTVSTQKYSPNIFSFSDKHVFIDLQRFVILVNQEWKTIPFKTNYYYSNGINLSQQIFEFTFNEELNFDCIVQQVKMNNQILTSKKEKPCENTLTISTKKGKCLVKFKKEILEDCELLQWQNPDMKIWSPAREENCTGH